jgi:hypothetical protein
MHVNRIGNFLKLPLATVVGRKARWITLYTRDVVYLGWPMAPSNAGGGGKLRGLSQWVQLQTGAQIYFGDLNPYLTYDTNGREVCQSTAPYSRISLFKSHEWCQHFILENNRFHPFHRVSNNNTPVDLWKSYNAITADGQNWAKTGCFMHVKSIESHDSRGGKEIELSRLSWAKPAKA